MASEKKTGKVKWFNSTKGFGFISPDDGSEDLFVHQTSIQSEGFRSLAEGEEVEFVVEEGEDGRTKAQDVTGPNGAPVKGTSGPNGGGRGRGSRFGGGRGYGGGYGGGGGGGGACYNCGGGGHLARDCTEGGRRSGPGSRGGSCYNCGETGHLARECTAAS